jgi:transcriptional regulator with XRE-family HTH domain
MDTVLKLRELRRMRGLSQKEAALSSGVGEKTLSSFESGTRIDGMKIVQLLALLQVYDITPAEFFEGKVEAEVFAELERLSPPEFTLIREIRALPEAVRTCLMEKFLAMIEAAEALRPVLRAVR